MAMRTAMAQPTPKRESDIVMLHDKIYNAAKELIRRIGTRDPFVICRAVGVNVVETELGSLKGMYTRVLRNRYALINSSLDERTRRVVCAHELGHDRLHGDLAGDFRLREFVLYRMDERPEYEANIFAAHLLLDEEEVYSYVKEGYDVVQIAAFMDTDVNLMLLKLCEMNTERDLKIRPPARPRSNFLRY
jgi:Zn-dependent peptidase ImmA (M78 family)